MEEYKIPLRNMSGEIIGTESITTFNMTTTTGSSTTFAVTSSLITTTSSLVLSLSNYSGRL
jgi:hypothetical protein